MVDNVNVQSAGPRGPVLLQDIWLIEKLAHFDREVIPERRMHAKGSGAFGVLRVTQDITRYTQGQAVRSRSAKRRQRSFVSPPWPGSVAPPMPSVTSVAFAIKLYTDEGNWDIVGNNTPVFFFRDPLRFPDLNHAVKRDPRTGLRSPDNNWDFWTALPEALHQVTIVMSERGIPKSYRTMHGFGSHTFRPDQQRERAHLGQVPLRQSARDS